MSLVLYIALGIALSPFLFLVIQKTLVLLLTVVINLIELIERW